MGLQTNNFVSLCAPWYLMYIICPILHYCIYMVWFAALLQDLQLNWGPSHLFPRCCRLDDLEFTARYVLMWIDMDWYASWRLLGPIGTFAILFHQVAGEPLPRPLGLASCLCRKRNLWCDLCQKLLVGSKWIAAVGCLMTDLKELYIQSTSRDQTLLISTLHLSFTI